MSRRLEIGALVGLCFFLPLYEAPKSIFWFLYAVFWLANRWRARDGGGRWDRWDTLIAVWIGSGFAVAALAGLHADEWRGAIDLLRYGSVLWLAKRSRYDEREIRWILGALLVSTIIGVVWAVWTLTTRINYLELNSVGHVNHTAIYLAIMLGLCAAWIFAGGRLPAVAATAFVLLALFLTASRAALLVGFALLLILAWPHSWRAVGLALAVIAVTTLTAWIGVAEVVRKQEEYVQQGAPLARRTDVWRMGMEAFRRFPVAGVGIDNYNLITYDMVRDWRAARGQDYDPALYARYGHGHSLYVNTLAERGVLGSLPLAALLAAWFVALWRGRPRAGAASQDWLLWGGAASACVITGGVGLANTTLHHEHGILAMLLLGLWLSKRPAR